MRNFTLKKNNIFAAAFALTIAMLFTSSPMKAYAAIDSGNGNDDTTETDTYIERYGLYDEATTERYLNDTAERRANSTTANTNRTSNSTTTNTNRTSNSTTTTTNSTTSILKPEYFDDDNFYQLNVAIIPKNVYALSDYNRLQTTPNRNWAFDRTVDASHIAKSYVAPVTDKGVSYMSEYDYTYMFSNDELTAAFINLMKTNTTLRNKIMTTAEYNDLISVYDTYVNNSKYDVNSYVYHYIVEYIDITYGDKLFNYDFYCEKYPSLAVLFDYDEDALKQHFYSVGMFEGRQAIETFNVDNYTTDNDDFATYYIKYVTSSDSSKSYKRTSKDAMQIKLYDVGFDSYVADTALDHKSPTFVEDLATPYVQGELNALASDRIRFQLGHIDAYGHTYMRTFAYSKDTVLQVWNLTIFNGLDGGENATTTGIANINALPNLMNSMTYWRDCPKHYKAAISTSYVYVAQAHPYVDYNPNPSSTGDLRHTQKYVITNMTWMFPKNNCEYIANYYANLCK